MSLRRLLHTVRYLRYQQILGQVRSRLNLWYEKQEAFNDKFAPAYAGCRWCPVTEFLPPGLQHNSAAKILTGQLCFLNNMQNTGWPPKWNCDNLPKLWQYNLHYCDYLWGLDYEHAKLLAWDWITNYPLKKAQIGWQGYPASLRLTNFCAIFFGKYRKQTEADTVFLRKLWGSIYVQAEWLTKHLEIHLLGNHLFENGAALAFAGSCFAGRAADKWLRKGIRILAKEIPEQVLNDGTHFELSPMYHCRITYLLAMLLNTNHPQLVTLTKEPLKKMVNALRHITHPDGRIALLNDSAFGIYNAPAQLVYYAGNFFEIDNAGTGNFTLPEAGYYGFRDDKGTYVICDAARIGPDYIPGHAHADIFSFELSLKGQRVIVDSGVYNYETGQMRQYCRATKAHNTVEINGQDQCEMWAAFRVGRRGRPHNIKWIAGEDGFELSAWHDGYKRQKGGCVHYREFNWNKAGKLIVRDIITASKPQSIISRVHLHPNCKIDHLKDSTVRVAYPEGYFRISFSGNGNLSLEDSYYCPEFGVKIPNKALAFSFSGCKTEAGFQIEAL